MPVVQREDGAEIWWDAQGPLDAPAVLLVMGLAYPADMWWRLLPHLAKDYRVIRSDNRGAGRTGDVAGGPYTVETMAADSLAALTAAGRDEAHVLGISMGGLIAQEIALSAPERVTTLILGCTHPGTADAVFSDEAMAMLANRAGMSVQEAAEASIPFNYAPSTPRHLIEEDWAVRLPLAATMAGYSNQLAGASQWKGLPRTEGIDKPTLIIHGEGDRLVLPENGERLAKIIPGAEHVTISDANHIFFTDQEERSSEIILEWLGRQR